MAKSKVITVSEFSNSTAANSAKRISDINNIQISITENGSYTLQTKGTICRKDVDLIVNVASAGITGVNQINNTLFIDSSCTAAKATNHLSGNAGDVYINRLDYCDALSHTTFNDKGLVYNFIDDLGIGADGINGVIKFCRGSAADDALYRERCGASLQFTEGDNSIPIADIYDRDGNLVTYMHDGLIGNVQEKTVTLNLASGNQVIQDFEFHYQSEATQTNGECPIYYNKVIITKPSTLIPSNIRKGVTIAGVTGTYEGI